MSNYPVAIFDDQFYIGNPNLVKSIVEKIENLDKEFLTDDNRQINICIKEGSEMFAIEVLALEVQGKTSEELSAFIASKI